MSQLSRLYVNEYGCLCHDLLPLGLLYIFGISENFWLWTHPDDDWGDIWYYTVK